MEFKLDLGGLRRYQPFLPYVGAAAIILLTLSLLTSSLGKVSNLRETNARLEQENKDLAEKLTQLKSFVDEGLEDKIGLTLKALPRTKDPVFILSAAKLLAIENGLMAEEISFSPGKISKEEVKGSSKVEEVKVAIKATGALDQGQAFLKRVYQILPVVGLEKASFNFSAEKGSALDAVLTFYFSPVESEKVSEKIILPTTAEEKAYEEIAKLEVLGRGELAAEEGALETFDPARDPFVPSSQGESLSP
ncbi:hypothetical protein KBI33_00160 [Candidatus Shapirobacteria bacterium]|nr:hypothetical protein [Candidatus Shapirobacteria bacterium]